MIHKNKDRLRVFFKDNQWTKELKIYESGHFPCGWGTMTPLIRCKYIKTDRELEEVFDLLNKYLSDNKIKKNSIIIC